MLEKILNAALEGEMDAHLTEESRAGGNRRNGKMNKQVKTPKLYFYDTGLACSLLNIISAEQVSSHYLRGELFENLVVNEFIKHSYNNALTPNLTFWRDSTGNEIDLIDYTFGEKKTYEIKSSHTFPTEFLKGLIKWSQLSHNQENNNFVIYNGKDELKTSDATVVPWEKFGVMY